MRPTLASAARRGRGCYTLRSRLRNAEVAARRLVGRRCSRATESAASAYSPATGEAAAADDVHDEVEDGDNDSGDGAEGEGQ